MKKLILTSLVGMALSTGALAGGACTTTVADVTNAWSGLRIDDPSQVSIGSPGFEGTDCKILMNASAGGTSNDTDIARLKDVSPSCETSFRARFLVDFDELGVLDDNQRNKLYTAQCVPAQNGGTCTGTGVIQFKVRGNSGVNDINGFVSDVNQPDLRSRFTLPIQAGVNTYEVQWIQASAPGASDGEFRAWANNTTLGSPDVSITNLNNNGYCIDQVNLGMFKPTRAWANNKTGLNIAIDEYESRRQTPIGLN